MSYSQREDYLLRQARAIAAMLARIAGLRLEGGIEESRAELEHAYGELLGARSDLMRRLDAPTAAMLLGHPESMLAFARLSLEEAAQTADPQHAASLRARAVALANEAAERDPENEEIRAFVREVSSGS